MQHAGSHTYLNSFHSDNIQVPGADSSIMAQSSFQNNLGLCDHGNLLVFWYWTQCIIHDTNNKGKYNCPMNRLILINLILWKKNSSKRQEY